MMKEYAGTEKLHKNDDADTKNSNRKLYGKKVPPESLMITHCSKEVRRYLKFKMLAVRKWWLFLTCFVKINIDALD